ncbi:MAG: IS21 family transposase [Bacteroidales bacterium]
MRKLMQKLIMYYEVHKFKREGLKTAQISRHLILDYRTVKKYLAMSEQEYQDFLEVQSSRHKLLAPYEDYIKARLEDCEDASAAQVHDWLKENFEDFIDVNSKTVFNFVLFVRNKHGIPKPFDYRDYTQADELPYGKQAQVDFGEYNITTDEDKRKKIYFFCMVFSRSRQKFVWFSERPFTTLTTIATHDKAFQYMEGIPAEIVYDQDTLLLVEENKGDLILTEAFRKYAEYRKFKLHFCRKSDPESKGKIENVVKYVKYNFLRGRNFVNIDTLNGQGMSWLSRTANAKVHAATNKIPYQEWLIEKTYLRPVMESFKPENVLGSYNVRKDNTISFKANFYRVPVGTYKPPRTTVWTKVTNDDRLIIYDAENNKIASHNLYSGKGKTIGGSNYKRDFSSGIDQLIDQLSGQFTNPDQAKEYLLQIRHDKPRYIRDQLQHVKKLTGIFDMEVMDQAMDFCIENRIYRATDLESVVKKIHQQSTHETTITKPIIINTINRTAHKIIPNKSDISDYQSIMN